MMDLNEPLLEQEAVGREQRRRWSNSVEVLFLLSIALIIWLLQPSLFQTTWVLYGPLINMIFALWLWAKNLELFSFANVDLQRDLHLGPRRLPPSYIFQCIRVMRCFGMLAFIVHFFIYSYLKSEQWAALAPAILYISIAVISIIPCGFRYQYSLVDLGGRLYRNILLCSTEDPQFANTFVADIMTSMMKVFVDIGSLLCRVACDLVAFCGGGYWGYIASIFLILPNLIRLFQCIRLWRDVRNIIYAGKYLLVIVVICLSVLHFGDWPFGSQDSSASPTKFFIWLGFCCCSSVYSIFCDVRLDWNTSRFAEFFTSNPNIPCHSCPDRGKTCVILFDGAIRFSWLLKTFLPASYLLDFLLTFLEVYRRFQGTIFRVLNFVNQQNGTLAGIQEQNQPNEDEEGPAPVHPGPAEIEEQNQQNGDGEGGPAPVHPGPVEIEEQNQQNGDGEGGPAPVPLDQPGPAWI